jgi:hypothetical protein
MSLANAAKKATKEIFIVSIAQRWNMRTAEMQSLKNQQQLCSEWWTVSADDEISVIRDPTTHLSQLEALNGG